MSDDNNTFSKLLWYRYTAVFRDFINRRQLLQKRSRANHLQCSHRFSLPCMLMVLYVCLSPRTRLSWCWHLCYSFNVCRAQWPAADVIYGLHAVMYIQWLKFVRMRWSGWTGVLRWQCRQIGSSRTWSSVGLKPKNCQMAESRKQHYGGGMSSEMLHSFSFIVTTCCFSFSSISCFFIVTFRGHSVKLLLLNSTT